MAFWDIIFNSFSFLKVFKHFFNKNVSNFNEAKMDFLGLPKRKVFWSKAYDVIVSVHDLSNPNCIVDMVMWPKYGNSFGKAFLMEEVIKTSIL